MKKAIAIATLVSLLIILLKKLTKGEKTTIGKISDKPAKVRIVYSKKLKPEDRPKIASASDAVRILREIWSSQIEVREEFVVLLLDRSNRVLGYHLLSKGGMTATVVDTRLIFAVAIESLATSIILAHNHPSGNLKASEADIAITQKIKKAGKIQDIELLDHIILTRDGHLSFLENLLL